MVTSDGPTAARAPSARAMNLGGRAAEALAEPTGSRRRRVNGDAGED